MNRQTVKTKQSLYSPGQTLSVPGDKTPRFEDNRHMKVVRLSALRTGRLYPPFLLEDESSVAERIMSIKNSNDTTGDRTRDFLACSAVSQSTAPPHVPLCKPDDSQITSSSSHLRKASRRLELRTLGRHIPMFNCYVGLRILTEMFCSRSSRLWV